MDFTVSENIDINNTSCQGIVNLKNLHRITGRFGQPTHRGLKADGFGKINVQWCIQFADGTIATIYDWKNWRDGYHVGGHSERAFELVKEILG